MSQQKVCVRAVVVDGDRLLAMKRDKFGRQYYTLIGGHVESGEELEVALRRELREETGLQVGAVRLVWTEDAGETYGVQYIYVCEYLGGEPVLTADSDEAVSNAGDNRYKPLWLPVAQLPQTVFRSSSVKQALLDALGSSFPEKTVRLAWKPEDVAQ